MRAQHRLLACSRGVNRQWFTGVPKGRVKREPVVPSPGMETFNLWPIIVERNLCHHSHHRAHHIDTSRLVLHGCCDTYEHIVGSKTGVFRTRAVQRLTEDRSWSADAVTDLEWTPLGTAENTRGRPPSHCCSSSQSLNFVLFVLCMAVVNTCLATTRKAYCVQILDKTEDEAKVLALQIAGNTQTMEGYENRIVLPPRCRKCRMCAPSTRGAASYFNRMFVKPARQGLLEAAGYHLGGNNYSFDALQAYCFGINIKL